MYAIIEDSGTQIRVSQGDKLEIDARDAVPDGELTFDRVLLVGRDQGEAKIGTPYVKGASVTARVIGPVLGEKIDVWKVRRRKNYRRKQGHRQHYLAVEITGIKG